MSLKITQHHPDRPRRDRRGAPALLAAQQDRRAAARRGGRTRSSPGFYILPAYLAIVPVPHLPGDPDGDQQLPGRQPTELGRLRELHELLVVRQVPADALQHAAVDRHRARRHGDPGTRDRGARRPAQAALRRTSSKTIIFLPMAISMVGAATVWRFVYAYRPEGQPQIGLQNAIITALGFDPVAWLQESQFHLNSLMLMVILLWAQVGFSMVLLSAAVKGVPGDTSRPPASTAPTSARSSSGGGAADQGHDRHRLRHGRHRRHEDLRHRLRDDQRQLQHQRDRQRVLQPAHHATSTTAPPRRSSSC